MSTLIDKNPKFNAHTFDDLVRLGNMGDKEATLELGLRFLINDEDFIHPDDCPDCEDEIDRLNDSIDNLQLQNDDLHDEIDQLKNDMNNLLTEEN